MSPLNVFQFVAATAIFMIAAVSAKSWALSPNLAKTIITLVLYTLGNILMMRLVRSVGMSTAFSLSAVLQLIAINIIAILAFGEKLGWAQGLGVALGVVSVALITLGPALSSS
jgi:multidrug transporter EmrE-like cation transporter